MQNAAGQKVVRLGDKTDHGGKVISATSGFVVNGIVAAQGGDMTHCPKCKGDFAILGNSGEAQFVGQSISFDGTETACGAKLLSSFVEK